MQIGDFPEIKDLGIAEAIALGTATAAVGAALYNYGFFFDISSSALSLLSFQDMLTSTVVAIPYVVFGTLFLGALALNDHIMQRSKPSRIPDWLPPSLAAGVMVIMTGIAVPFAPQGGRLLGAVALLAIAGVLATSAVAIRTDNKWISLIGTALTVAVASAGFGAAAHATIVDNPSKIISTIERTDGRDAVTGTILRISSGYVFVLQGAETTIIPISDVATIKIPE